MSKLDAIGGRGLPGRVEQENKPISEAGLSQTKGRDGGNQDERPTAGEVVLWPDGEAMISADLSKQGT